MTFVAARMFCGKSNVARYSVEFDRVQGLPNPGHQNIAHSPADTPTGNTFYDDIELHMSCCYNCSEFSYPMVYFLQPLCGIPILQLTLLRSSN